MLVDKQKIWPRIVGDGDVGPAVVVEVRKHNAHALRFRFADTGRLTHVGKRAIVIVVVQLGFLSFVVSRIAVGPVAWALFAAPQIIFGRPFNIVGHHQIEPPVFVVVKPARAGGPPALIGDTRLGGDIAESSVAVVVIQNRAAVASHVEIGVAVIVVIPDRHSLPVVSFATDTRLFGNVGKRSVTVVVIQRG